ncbi:hypothetical protein BDA96_02G070000 [Sorghum bicolor]|uniref:Prolyl 4-hydroxylase alpha subunit domain-containing protein n=1 Tax=Sorghum bicolor TaxID=4558 RepID=A0A921URW1_SORBI|nr:hypothetical protein BDA96_02G070000 [Sorghum bicolor]
MRLRVVLLALAATAVVLVLLLGEDDDDAAAAAVVAPVPPFNPSRVKAVSWQPRIFVYKGFLSDDECDHLVTLVSEHRRRRRRRPWWRTRHNQSGYSPGRTSTGMFLNKRQDTVVSRIEERIAAWTFLPQENAESMQIQRYQHGQRYEPHRDRG